jgi:hypothetical protein
MLHHSSLLCSVRLVLSSNRDATGSKIGPKPGNCDWGFGRSVWETTGPWILLPCLFYLGGHKDVVGRSQ